MDASPQFGPTNLETTGICFKNRLLTPPDHVQIPNDLLRQGRKENIAPSLQIQSDLINELRKIKSTSQHPSPTTCLLSQSTGRCPSLVFFAEPKNAIAPRPNPPLETLVLSRTALKENRKTLEPWKTSLPGPAPDRRCCYGSHRCRPRAVALIAVEIFHVPATAQVEVRTGCTTDKGQQAIRQKDHTVSGSSLRSFLQSSGLTDQFYMLEGRVVQS